MPYGLAGETLERIVAVLSRHQSVERAVLYGSRAKGTHRPGSDIDLALSGAGLDLQSLNRICLDLDDLLLPYTFDVSLLDRMVNPQLKAHIERVGQEFYVREARAITRPTGRPVTPAGLLLPNSGRWDI
ncbi:MAG: nucleotidyltransferase domain-containing protein [Thermodesulfobacteriota bacterium]